MSHFQVIPFSELMSPEQLQAVMASVDSDPAEATAIHQVIADSKPGYPCRLSLEDAEPGETLILFHHCFHPAASPYRASGPLYVRLDRDEARLPLDELPAFLLHRFLSVRVYRDDGMMLDADVVAGTELSRTLEDRILPMIEHGAGYVHVHNASTGCFLIAIRLIDDNPGSAS